ncbi:MAG: nicotinamidase [Nitrososphaerota archaeon]|nr:nicotinamidase [Nitrososphaerota archaeon]
MRISLTEKSALIIVDVQNDFLPGGALAVPNGDNVIGPLNKYIELFKNKNLPVFATRDWHPQNHVSFKERGGLWPPHCIQNTYGAMISEKLKLPPNVKIIDKAFSSDRDSYSGFQETVLDLELRRLGVKRLFIGGLATDYCVKATVLDSLELGFETILLLDAIRGVDVKPKDSEEAIKTMILKGAIAITLEDLVNQ